MFISPKKVLQDFLRHRITDPQNRAEATKTETFDGGGTEFDLNPDNSFSAITDVSVGGTTQSKWKDYYIDEQNSKVIFYENTPSGTGNVSISYKQGDSNWIYADKPREDLSVYNFPRINILSVGGTDRRTGTYKSNVESSILFQIDVWTKEKQVFTINNKKYEGDKLSEYLAYEVHKAFKDHVDEIHPQLYNYTGTQHPRDLGFDREMQCFHHIMEVELNALNSGEV